ncbi:MAG TPA: chitobiase/beta-hexosaminidase C-terminal domain-containing protein [Polyangiales bacterium]|nr:chitobiase/beta-hexosaminidase C-terminal domain-containing protein [Polyangiales bacterium]
MREPETAGSAGAAPPAAAPQPPAAQPSPPARRADIATPPLDAAAPDSAAGSDGEADDAGTDDAEPDAAVIAPIPPRADGCPEDAPLPVDRVRVLSGGASGSIVGARIQGSNSSPTTDFVDLTTIERAPAAGAFAELQLENTQRYRYIRYYAPPGSQAGVAELEFFSGPRRLSGAPFGTANADAQHSFARALDEDRATYFSPTAYGGGYVGLDIARGYVTEPVSFTPAASSFSEPVEVTLSSATVGASIRYTDDDTEPTGSAALTYSAPIVVSTGRTTLRALASAACRFDSSVEAATYTVGSSGEPSAKGLRSYHIGNSLTDTINPWLEPIADSTGVDHEYARWTIPGAPIKWLAEHQGEGFEDPEGAASFDSFVAKFAPIDHLSLQPYSDPSFESQGGAAVGLLTTALRFNPDIQFWMYAQWPGRTEWATDSFSAGGGTVYPEWQVPRAPSNWEEGTQNEVLYVEAFRDYVDARVGGKPIRVVPGGLALVALKQRIDAGSVPGFSNFFDTFFEDEAHLKPPAQYLIALVFYACLYGRSPVDRVTSAGTGLTSAQARIFQQIAWDVVSTYPGSGVRP